MRESDAASPKQLSKNLRAAANWLFLLALTVAMVYAALAAATPIAQSHGSDRQRQLFSVLAFGVLGGTFWSYSIFHSSGTSQGDSRLRLLVFLIPTYGALQVMPLPIAIVRFLSPMKAALSQALETTVATQSWTPLSVTPSETVYQSLVLATCAILLCVVCELKGQFLDSPWILAFPLILLGTSESVLGLIQSATLGNREAIGTFAVRNHYAGLLEMVFPFAVAYSFSPLIGPSKRWELGLPAVRACASAICAVVILAAIVESRSRMGFLGSCLGVIFVIGAVLSMMQSRRVIAWAATAISLLVLLPLVPSTLLLLRFAQTNDQERVKVWFETIALIKAYPLFGCGLGGYESAFSMFKQSGANIDQDYAHNDYLQYLSELGLFGFALAILLLTLIGSRVLTSLKHADTQYRLFGAACGASLLAIGLHSFVDFNLYVPVNLFTLAYVLGMAANQRKCLKDGRQTFSLE